VITDHAIVLSTKINDNINIESTMAWSVITKLNDNINIESTIAWSVISKLKNVCDEVQVYHMVIVCDGEKVSYGNICDGDKMYNTVM
jgi:hypothetical protein